MANPKRSMGSGPFKSYHVPFILFLGFATAALAVNRSVNRFEFNSRADNNSLSVQPEECWIIEVSGAVNKGGVYTFFTNPNVAMAVEKAGGLKNPQLRLLSPQMDGIESGTLINIIDNLDACIAKAQFSSMSVAKKLVLGMPVELASTTVDDLRLVPSISISLAKEIASYKDQHSIMRWEDLLHIKGMGTVRLGRLKQYFQLKKSDPNTFSAL